jgi:replication factor C subunit 1
MQIRSRIMSIAYKEGISIEPNAIDQLVTATHSDIRQILNLLQTWHLNESQMTYDDSKNL